MDGYAQGSPLNKPTAPVRVGGVAAARGAVGAEDSASEGLQRFVSRLSRFGLAAEREPLLKTNPRSG